MLLNIHPNEWVQYTSRLQSVVQSRKDENGTGASIGLDQLP